MIVVEKDGVGERKKFLEQCVVFRFASGEVINWVIFRKWANRHWGVAVDSSFLSIGDDLWMLVCSSVPEARRVLALERKSFNSVEIQMDRWIEEAGRLDVMANFEVAWIRVRGIPLHLRSKQLYESIGDFCGGFLGSDEGTSLSHVRIKVRTTTTISDEIPLCFELDVYPIRVEM
ncbi:hypothetical protein LINGRAHAP2_LOCUS8364 [Linum grandiflorum]